MNKNTIFKPGTVKEIDKKSREITFVVSDGQVDRHGDSLNPNGWQIENYMQNPVVLFGHNYKDLPIGKTLKIWVENGSQVLARMKFADHDFADKVWKLIKDGFLNATSVGFIPLKYDEEGNHTFSDMELLEISVVPVPANPRALGRKEIGLLKELEAETGEAILEKSLRRLIKLTKVEDTSEPEKTETDAPESVATLTAEEINDLVVKAVQTYIEQQNLRADEANTEAESQTKEVLIAMRELLKSSDKSTELALKKLKELVS